MLVLSVSQINTYLSFKFKEDKKLSGVLVRGEISNFTAHRTGHFYFTLKDDKSSIRAVMFKSYASKMKFMPREGMGVIVMGSISVFERDGTYQVYATDIIPDGAGEQFTANEQLKEKLRKEGIFDEKIKRQIPPMPSKIGVVTSSGGAALQDIINILSRRSPTSELVVINALVQGDGAPDSVCKGIIKAENLGCDVVIIARGGGSLEDLSPFNTEKVAYGIYNCSVPVISAVGHETDFTIADMAADLRVPTPSAAAELVAVSKERLLGNLSYYDEKLKAVMDRYLQKLAAQNERLDERLLRSSPMYRLDKQSDRLESFNMKLETAFGNYMSARENKLEKLIDKMEAVSPNRVLERGYSLVYSEGTPVTHASDLKKGTEIEIRMQDGSVRAVIIE